jgi:hypothetical protein
MIREFLVYLMAGGAIVAVSWAVEGWAWFQNLESNAKQWFIFGSSVVLAVGAWGINTYVPSATLDSLQPVFAILATLFASVFLGQAFHFYEKKN